MTEKHLQLMYLMAEIGMKERFIKTILRNLITEENVEKMLRFIMETKPTEEEPIVTKMIEITQIGF